MEPERDRNETPEVRIVPLESTELLDANSAFGPIPPPRPRRQFRSRKGLALLLFLATCVSTFLVGGASNISGALRHDEVIANVRKFLVDGISYAGPLMLILLAHEMGHYLQARRYNVPATLPFFIPMPFTPIGTMGAVIVQGAGVADRRQLFDIAISGPLAGLVLALPITFWGLRESTLANVGPNSLIYGDPLILRWMIELKHGPLQPGQEVLLNPMLFAGWVGIFITALNLVPIGQLDGGHILYTLIGRRANSVAVGLLWGAVAYMIYTKQASYSLMIVLLFLMGPRHPPTANDAVPLGSLRTLLGWLTLAFIVLGFTPEPMMIR